MLGGIRLKTRSLANSQAPRQDQDLDVLTERSSKHAVRLFMLKPSSPEEWAYVAKASKGLKGRNPIYYHFGRGLDGIKSTVVYFYQNPMMEGQIRITTCQPTSNGTLEIIYNNTYDEQSPNKVHDPYLSEVMALNRELLLGALDSSTVNQRIDAIRDRYNWTEIACD